MAGGADGRGRGVQGVRGTRNVTRGCRCRWAMKKMQCPRREVVTVCSAVEEFELSGEVRQVKNRVMATWTRA